MPTKRRPKPTKTTRTALEVLSEKVANKIVPLGVSRDEALEMAKTGLSAYAYIVQSQRLKDQDEARYRADTLALLTRGVAALEKIAAGGRQSFPAG